MEFANQAHETSTFFTAHPEPFHLFWLIVVFVLNFIIARFFSIHLVKAGYVKKYSTIILITKVGKRRHMVLTGEYKKLFILWFFPIVCAAGLMALYITCALAKTLVAIKQKLFLNHI